MTRRRAILTVLLAALPAVGSAWILLRPNETAVYDAVLAPFPQARPILANAPANCGAPAQMDGVSDSLLSSFRAANAPGTRPLPLLGLGWRYDTLKRMDPGLLRLARAQGRAVLSLSRVGFEGNEALVCMEGRFGSEFLHLRYANGAWQVVGEAPLTES